ncbi:4019_t:CDS:2, partial [Gigaspora margarita]
KALSEDSNTKIANLQLLSPNYNDAIILKVQGIIYNFFGIIGKIQSNWAYCYLVKFTIESIVTNDKSNTEVDAEVSYTSAT